MNDRKHLLRPVVGKDDEVAHWVCSKLPIRVTPEELGKYVTIGLTDKNGKLVAGCIYHRWRGFDCEVTFASTTPAWTLPYNLAPLFHYPFVQRACARITLVIGANNKAALKTNVRIGFTLEGIVRRAYDGQQDAYILGMLRDECKWISTVPRRRRRRRRQTVQTMEAVNG